MRMRTVEQVRGTGVPKKTVLSSCAALVLDFRTVRGWLPLTGQGQQRHNHC